MTPANIHSAFSNEFYCLALRHVAEGCWHTLAAAFVFLRVSWRSGAFVTNIRVCKNTYVDLRTIREGGTGKEKRKENWVRNGHRVAEGFLQERLLSLRACVCMGGRYFFG